jgi:hypothetical protein
VLLESFEAGKNGLHQWPIPLPGSEGLMGTCIAWFQGWQYAADGAMQGIGAVLQAV